MANLVISKDGVEFKEIPDTEEMQQAAEAKGYKRYLNVTKDGKDIKTIPATDEMVKAAFGKGYKTLDQIDAENAPDAKPTESNAAMAGVRGVAQGATMGFADELTARVGDTLGIRSYDKIRDSARAQDVYDREVNPVASYGGNVVGGIASMAIPGVAAAKGAGFAKNAASAIGGGAIASYGASDAEYGSDALAEDTATGAAVGGALSTVAPILKGVGNLGKKALTSKPIEGAASEAAYMLGDIPRELGEKIIENPKLNAQGKGLTALGEDAAAVVEKLSQQVRQADDAAWKLLQQSNAPYKAEFTGIADNITQRMNLTGNQPAQRAARDAIQTAEQDLAGAKSWEELRKAIQRTRNNINYQTPGKDLENDALKALAAQADDALKQSNEAYREAMGPIADSTRRLELLKKSFGLAPSVDGIATTDKTVPAVKGLTRDMGRETKSSVKDAIKNTDEQLLNDLDVEGVYQKTQGDSGRGGRSVYGGIATGAAAGSVGGPVGMVVGGALGGFAGLARDKYGKQVAASFLQKASAGIQGGDAALARAAQAIDASWEGLSPKAKEAIAASASRGPQAIVATWSVMKDK